VTLCGASLSLTTTAQAQNGRIGTVLGVRLGELPSFRLANSVRGVDAFGNVVQPNDVTVLHVSAVAGAPINSAIATVSVTQRFTGLKAWRVYFPRVGNGISPYYQYINGGDSFTNPRFFNNVGVVQVDVRQPNTGSFLVENARFLLIPIHRIISLQRENPGATFEVVHAQRMASSFGSFWVQLVAVDESTATRLRVPTDLAVAIRVLNSNISVGPGNLASGTAIAVVR
jgi:hypothetical protein